MRFFTQKQNNYSKCSAFDSSALCSYFSIQTLQFWLTRGARIFLAPERRIP